MRSLKRTWSEAFLLQANSDRDAYEHLAQTDLPASHGLHALQMWLEKLCKAYIYQTDIHALKMSHNVVARVLPRLMDEHWNRIGFVRRPRIAEIRELCRQIDLLHPQVDEDRQRPDNVEYPWLGFSGEIECPASWDFPILGRLNSLQGRLFLKAADRLTRNRAILIANE